MMVRTNEQHVMRLAGTVSWLHDVLCSISFDDCWLKRLVSLSFSRWHLFFFFFDLHSAFFYSYLPMATSYQSETSNPEKYHGVHQLSLHRLGSQLLSRWFHGNKTNLFLCCYTFVSLWRHLFLSFNRHLSGFKLARNAHCLRERILHWNNHTCCIDSPQLRGSCEALSAKAT